MKASDYTVQGVLNWICIQEDAKDMGKIINGCIKKIEAMNWLKRKEKKNKSEDPNEGLCHVPWN